MLLLIDNILLQQQTGSIIVKKGAIDPVIITDDHRSISDD